MKSLKWISVTVLMAIMIVVAINGSLADNTADDKYLTIVQSELERDGTGIKEVASDHQMLPVTVAELTKQSMQLSAEFSVTDKKSHTVNANLLVNADMYTAENVLDHIVVITNTGNTSGYVRTWFAFEMGDLTEGEFKESVAFNQNTTDWTWESFNYGVEIDGERYAVVCAKYGKALDGGQTTTPNLLQILLQSGVSSDIANRLDGNHDGKYEVRAYSQVVSDSGAWSRISKPWGML